MNPAKFVRYVKTLMGILHGERAFIGPIRASFGLTNRCNVRCIHCFYYSPFLDKPSLQPLRLSRRSGEDSPGQEELRKLQQVDLDMERAQKTVKDLLRMGTRHYEFTGNGEPFLHPLALDLLSLVKRQDSTCLVKTNGTPVGRAMAEELVRIGLDELRVSTLAGTPEMYRKTHHGASESLFHRLKETLLYMAEQKAVRNVRHPLITLSFSILKQNVEGIIDFAKFAVEVKADRVRYWPVDPVDDPDLKKMVPTEDQAPILHEQLDEAKMYLASNNLRWRIYNPAHVFYTKLNTSSVYRNIPCYYGWLAVRVCADGEIYPCCRCYRSLGNIYESDFEEIWNGEKYRRYRREARVLPEHLKPVTGCDCYSCIHYKANRRMYQLLHPFRGK